MRLHTFGGPAFYRRKVMHVLPVKQRSATRYLAIRLLPNPAVWWRKTQLLPVEKNEDGRAAECALASVCATIRYWPFGFRPTRAPCSRRCVRAAVCRDGWCCGI